MKTIIVIASIVLVSGCAVSPAKYWYVDCDESTFKLKISAASLGQLVDYEHTYKAKKDEKK